MSLGLVSHNNQRKMSDGRYVGDLAALFERRRIDLGEPHVCEQFEILLTTSDAFRGQLFTLCTAISHMGEEDRTGEELLDLIARALRTESEDGAALPAPLRQNFLAGYDAWTKRGFGGDDEWPARKKPVASVSHAPSAAPEKRSVQWHSEPMREEPSHDASEQTAAPARPAGVPTLQEALEMARTRGGNRPLRPEPEGQPEAAAHAEPATAAEPVTHGDANSTAIHELNTLLGEIEERMKRLRPQLVTTETPASNVPALPEPVQSESAMATLQALGLLKPEILGPGVPVRPEVPVRPAVPVATAVPALPAATPEPLFDDGDAAFYARHPYLLNKRPVPAIDLLEAEPVEELTPIMRKPQGEPELQLVPRQVAEMEPVKQREKPAPPTLVIPESIKLKTYLAIAVLAGIVLVGTPISAVMAYRYLHPLYMYEPAKPQPDPAATAPTDTTTAGKPGSAQKSGSRGKGRKAPGRHKPSVAVWPPQ
jgi:hypothetical protein